jgi:hypothetical protein
MTIDFSIFNCGLKDKEKACTVLKINPRKGERREGRKRKGRTKEGGRNEGIKKGGRKERKK